MMKAPSLRTSTILVVALCVSASEAQACGEVMLRTLDTMRFHAFASKHPTTILLYSSESANHPPAVAAKLHDSLEKAGHKVSIARGPEQLANALATQKYAIIIAPADDIAMVTTEATKASREPTLIPVLDGVADEQQVRARYPHVVRGNLREILKTIEESMKSQDL